MRIGITGANGLIGWHLRCFFSVHPEISVFPADRSRFTDITSLRKFVSDCDTIIHLAGMNRGNDEEVMRINLLLAEMLTEACRAEHCTPHMIFASSTHIFRNSRYGDAKRQCSELFRRWSREEGAIFTNLILPNIFGENGRPFYNSVISTFCYQLAHNEKPRIEIDAIYDYLHCYQIGEHLLNILQSKPNHDVIIRGCEMSVREILGRLTFFNDNYRSGVIPDCMDLFNLALFNTYRSHLYPSFYPRFPEIRRDDRGYLFEVTKSFGGGQSFISTTRPGIIRGNHFHFHKIERFGVLKGDAVIQIRRLFDDRITSFTVSGHEPCFIDMPTLHTHSITNTGTDDLITLFWSNEIFDPSRPDTFSETVVPA
jgi:UDP-2-acetamido-2,6-beta-L-arabino-hexul-4-ose reductase